MHLKEGQSSIAKYRLHNPVNSTLQLILEMGTVNVRMVSQSAANTIISATATADLHTDANQSPLSLLHLNVTAGVPGDTAVAWLVTTVDKGLLNNGFRTGINNKMTFIQPVVVHPTPLPLLIQEIALPDKNKRPYPYHFSLKDQHYFEQVVPVS